MIKLQSVAMSLCAILLSACNTLPSANSTSQDVVPLSNDSAVVRPVTIDGLQDFENIDDWKGTPMSGGRVSTTSPWVKHGLKLSHVCYSCRVLIRRNHAQSATAKNYPSMTLTTMTPGLRIVA